MKSRILACIGAAMLTACATTDTDNSATTPAAGQQTAAVNAATVEDQQMREFMVTMDMLAESHGRPPAPGAEEVERLAESNHAHPLGSRENPVRAVGPTGQRAYLARLRCEDGRAPQFFRMGSFGLGPYGRILDGYSVSCAGDPDTNHQVFMDMYHPGYIEDEPVPGFTITD